MSAAASTDRRSEIAAAALEMVDAEGLDALSMRRLAARLEIGTMTLYGYFRTKDEMLDAVVEQAASEYEPPAEGPWEERLRAIARAWHRALIRHPALIALRLRRPLMGPEILPSTESGLDALVDAGFSPSDAARAFRVLFLYVFGSAGFNDPQVTRARRREVAAGLLSLPEERYPMLTSMAGEMADSLGGDEQFEFGLDAILAGLALRLRGRSVESS